MNLKVPELIWGCLGFHSSHLPLGTGSGIKRSESCGCPREGSGVKKKLFSWGPEWGRTVAMQHCAQMRTHVAHAAYLQGLGVGRLTADVLCHLRQSPPTVHSDKAHRDTPRHSSQWRCVHQLLGLGVQEELSPSSSPHSARSLAGQRWVPLTLASGMRALMFRSDTRISHTILSFSASGAWPGYSSCQVTGRVVATPPLVPFSTRKSTHRNSDSSRGLLARGTERLSTC